VLFVGQAIASTAVLLIKINEFHAFSLAAYRLLFAAVVASPLFVAELRKHNRPLDWSLFRPAILPGVFLAVHFLSWNIGARNTIAANASLIVNMLPVFLPLVVVVVTKERPKWFELLATGIAIAGLLVLYIPSFQGSRETLLGDLVCFGSMLLLASYLALGRKNRRARGLWLYLVPVYVVAGTVALAVAFLAGAPVGTDFVLVNVLTLAGLVVGPTIIGHGAVNRGMRRLPSQLVALSQVTQPVWAGSLAYFLFKELPHPLFAVAAASIIIAIVITIRGHAAERRAGADAGSHT
jgi:drug/metabolite transporter (DMT)-like permease